LLERASMRGPRSRRLLRRLTPWWRRRTPHVLQDYLGLTQAFIDTGFVGNPIEWRAKEEDPWQLTHPDGEPKEVMAKELRDRMEACPGGGSRFGALSVVLGDMGFLWQMYTPPYVILLIRTFLTLEGIAGKVDPNFNIYEVALPWAVQRALSPATAAGARTLRASLLTDDNSFQWARVHTLIEQQQAEEEEVAAAAAVAAAESEATDASSSNLPTANSARARLMAAEANTAVLDPGLAAAGADAQAAQAATPLESFTTVLGSSSGATLRRIMRDVDSTDLLIGLASPTARPVRRLAVQQLSEQLEGSMGRSCAALVAATKRLSRGRELGVILERSTVGDAMVGRVVPTNLQSVTAASGTSVAASSKPIGASPQPWPTSPTAAALEKRISARARLAGFLLLRVHAQRQLAAGWRGAAAVGALVYVTTRVVLAALVRSVVRSAASGVTALAPRPVATAAATAAAKVAGVLARELTAIGASMGKVAEEMKPGPAGDTA